MIDPALGFNFHILTFKKDAVQGSGFRVLGSGFRVQRFSVSGLLFSR
jgi:hypothetical protein